jgi:hypothetical protein
MSINASVEKVGIEVPFFNEGYVGPIGTTYMG